MPPKICIYLAQNNIDTGISIGAFIVKSRMFGFYYIISKNCIIANCSRLKSFAVYKTEL